MFDAMVLAAGFGTRLRPLTDEVPKPLLPIGHEPLLRRILRVLDEGGARRLVANAHHLAEKVLVESSGWGLDVHVMVEGKIRGTAGGIAGARHLFGELPVLLVNGDIQGDVPIAELLEAEFEGLVLAVVPRPVGEGTVGIGADGRVVRLRGETFGEEVRAGDYTGMARLSPSCVRALPEEGCLIGDYALPTLRSGGLVHTREVPSGFTDIGTPESYLAANLDWLLDGEESGVSEHAKLGPEVIVVDSVIGAGAVIRGSGLVERVVVLPGARAEAPLRDSIVLPSGRVVQLTAKGGP